MDPSVIRLQEKVREAVKYFLKTEENLAILRIRKETFLNTAYLPKGTLRLHFPHVNAELWKENRIKYLDHVELLQKQLDLAITSFDRLLEDPEIVKIFTALMKAGRSAPLQDMSGYEASLRKAYSTTRDALNDEIEDLRFEIKMVDFRSIPPIPGAPSSPFSQKEIERTIRELFDISTWHQEVQFRFWGSYTPYSHFLNNAYPKLASVQAASYLEMQFIRTDVQFLRWKGEYLRFLDQRDVKLLRSLLGDQSEIWEHRWDEFIAEQCKSLEKMTEKNRNIRQMLEKTLTMEETSSFSSGCIDPRLLERVS